LPSAGGAGAPKDDQRSDSSGLLSGGVTPWTAGEGVPGEGEVTPSGGTAAGGPGLAAPGGGEVLRPTGNGGVTVPSATGTEEAGAGETPGSGEAGLPAAMMPPLGTPGGAASRGDERSDASGLLSETETGWADPGHGDLPSETQGTAAGGAFLLGAETGAHGGRDEQPEDRVAVIPSIDAAEDTGAWEAADLAALWLSGRRGDEEEEEEFLPKYVLSDETGWADEDGAVPAAGVGCEEMKRADEADEVPAEEEGWTDPALAAGLGLLPPSAVEGTPAELATGPGLATWRPERSAAKDASSEGMPVLAGGYAGMLCSEGTATDEQEAIESAAGSQPRAGAGRGEQDDEEKGSGIAALLKEEVDLWGAGPDALDVLG
jgi:hypothetical protein